MQIINSFVFSCYLLFSSVIKLVAKPVAIISIVQGENIGVIGLIINLIIGGYLMFNSRVKSVF